MKQQNNITKEGHVLHSFTEDDCVILIDKSGEPHKAPMYVDANGVICYNIGKESFALPKQYRPQLIKY